MAKETIETERKVDIHACGHQHHKCILKNTDADGINADRLKEIQGRIRLDQKRNNRILDR